MIARVQQFIEKEHLIAPGTRVLVGVSGGVDSVVLLRILHRLGHPLVAAHVNYGLRDAAAADAAFVAALCRTLDVVFTQTTIDAQAEAAARGTSLQAAARVARYVWFGRQAAAHGCRQVAVGHHSDDQAETVLLNLFRGSGLEGLAGMPPRRRLDAPGLPWLIRPLLPLRRAALEAFAQAEGWPWREDATNALPTYRRNRLRLEILPRIEAAFGEQATANIARAAALVQAYLAVPETPWQAAWAACATDDGPAGGSLDLGLLASLPPVLQGRLILEAFRCWLPDWPRQQAQVVAVQALIGSQPGRKAEGPGGRVWRMRDALRFQRASEPIAGRPAARSATPFAFGRPAAVAGGTLVGAVLAGRPPTFRTNANTIYVDADRLEAPLTIRAWQAGDRFQPLGLAGHKKVSDLLTERKVAVHERAAVTVLCAAGKIVWVVGHRAAEAFKVQPSTQRVAMITLIPAP